MNNLCGIGLARERTSSSVNFGGGAGSEGEIEKVASYINSHECNTMIIKGFYGDEQFFMVFFLADKNAAGAALVCVWLPTASLKTDASNLFALNFHIASHLRLEYCQDFETLIRVH